MKNKKIIFIVILIEICFIIGIVLGCSLIKKYKKIEEQEKIESRKNSEIEAEQKEKEYFNENYNSGKVIGDNEIVFGYVSSINSNIVQLSSIYQLRGNKGIQCNEYTDVLINFDNVNEFDTKSLTGGILICQGKLVKNKDIKFLIPNTDSIKYIDTFYFINELNNIINTNQKIEDIELVDIDNNETNKEKVIYLKYISKINFKGKEINVPCILSAIVTDNTEFKNADNEKYQIGKRVNITFEDKVESIEVEKPKVKTIEYII